MSKLRPKLQYALPLDSAGFQACQDVLHAYSSKGSTSLQKQQIASSVIAVLETRYTAKVFASTVTRLSDGQLLSTLADLRCTKLVFPQMRGVSPLHNNVAYDSIAKDLNTSIDLCTTETTRRCLHEPMSIANITVAVAAAILGVLAITALIAWCVTLRGRPIP